MKHKSTEEKRFKIVRFAFEMDNGQLAYRHFITDKLLPAPVINEWLETNYMGSAQTGKEYGKRLTVFLNYLDEKGFEYSNASNREVKHFIMSLIYGSGDDLRIKAPENRISYSTVGGYVIVITSFYRWLDDNYETAVRFGERSRRKENSYLYGQIYDYSYKYILGIHLPKMGGKKQFIKWYTDEEIIKLSDNFTTLRDKAVFLVTLEGFRIDEVLSMRLEGYDMQKHVIQPSRSKGREDALYGDDNPHRTVLLPSQTCKILDQYIQTERMLAENQSSRLSEYLFLNLNQGKHQAEPLKYHNYYRSLKACALRAGMDAVKIRTHSGRSTKVMRMLEADASDTDILYHPYMEAY